MLAATSIHVTHDISRRAPKFLAEKILISEKLTRQSMFAFIHHRSRRRRAVICNSQSCLQSGRLAAAVPRLFPSDEASLLLLWNGL